MPETSDKPEKPESPSDPNGEWSGPDTKREPVLAGAVPGPAAHPTQPGPNQPGPARPALPGPPRPPGPPALRNPPPPLPNPALINPFRLGPPAPSLWERAWPKVEPSAGRGVLLGVLITALVAAAVLPADRPGLGWPIAGIALVVPLAVHLVRAKAATAAARIESLLWSAAAVGLLSVGLFRAAGWLFALCVLTAFGCVAIAAGRYRRIPAVLLAPCTLVLAAFRALPWAQAGAVRLRKARNATNGLRMLASIGVGVLLLLVFGALFASADAAFGEMVSAIVPTFDAGTIVRWTLVGVVFAALALGGAFLAGNPSRVAEAEKPARAVRRIEWLIPVGALLLMFGLFVAVQLTVFFGDRDYVMRTAGLTFAEYARRGFWQLTVITVLTLLVMAVAARKAPRDEPADRVLLRLVLGALAACSLVVVGSALWRMNVYEEAYGFTRLRVLVSSVELWLGGLFVLVLLAGLGPLRRRRTWLGRAGVALWVATLLGLAILNPDRTIAAHNVARADASNSDIWYLRSLSADAAPELAKLPEGARECALSDIADDLADRPDDWRGWNLARAAAREIVPGRVKVVGYPCYRRY